MSLRFRSSLARAITVASVNRAAFSKIAAPVFVSAQTKTESAPFKVNSLVLKPVSVRSFSTSSGAPQKAYTVDDFAKQCKEATPHQRFLATSVVMGVGIPVAFVLSPSIINFPIDLAIGIALPYHMHTGMLDVVNDYAPPQGKKPISVIVTLISVLVAIGLLKINLCGVGITQSLKSLWKKPAAKQAAPAIQQK